MHQTTLGKRANTKEFNITQWKVIRLGRTNSTFKCKFNELEQEETNKEIDSGWFWGVVGIAAAWQVNNFAAEIFGREGSCCSWGVQDSTSRHSFHVPTRMVSALNLETKTGQCLITGKEGYHCQICSAHQNVEPQTQKEMLLKHISLAETTKDVWASRALGCDHSSTTLVAFGVNQIGLSLLWLQREMHSGTKYQQRGEDKKKLQKPDTKSRLSRAYGAYRLVKNERSPFCSGRPTCSLS